MSLEMAGGVRSTKYICSSAEQSKVGETGTDGVSIVKQVYDIGIVS